MWQARLMALRALRGFCLQDAEVGLPELKLGPDFTFACLTKRFSWSSACWSSSGRNAAMGMPFCDMLQRSCEKAAQTRATSRISGHLQSAQWLSLAWALP